MGPKINRFLNLKSSLIAKMKERTQSLSMVPNPVYCTHVLTYLNLSKRQYTLEQTISITFVKTMANWQIYIKLDDRNERNKNELEWQIEKTDGLKLVAANSAYLRFNQNFF